MLMTKILEILIEVPDFLILVSLIYTIPPYGKWNVGTIAFTSFHGIYSVGLVQTSVKQNTGTPGIPLLCSSAMLHNHGNCLTV